LAHAGRWLSQAHPEVTSPAQWTRELAAEYVAAVLSLKIGAWSTPGRELENHGKPVGSFKIRTSCCRQSATTAVFIDFLLGLEFILR
jgi:hypothetical protein